MKKLTQEQIEEINDECQYNQGIFKEPFGIPNDIKELVVYTRWESGGRPGSCWDDENTINDIYYNDRPNDAYEILSKVLKVIDPNISDLQQRAINGLWDSNQETEYGYYGDYTDETIEWILLEDIYKLLNITD